MATRSIPRWTVLAVLTAISLCAASTPVPQTLGDARAKHWAFQPVARPPLPAVKNEKWVHTPVDRFILAALEAKKMKPAAEADPRTLIRRLAFDLTGLPPTFAEVEAFSHDRSPDAYEKAVDRLLDSPAYGQRWARHWLDVARYADTMGYNFTSDPRYPFAWTYRDYVVDAFNRDKPYDRFIVEQLAADAVETGVDKKSLAAMGFLTVGRRFDFDIHATIDDRIDVVTRGLLALTVGCARCHDHKYDAIASADYYALYGVFRSCTEPDVNSQPVIGGSEDPAAQQRFEAELKKRQQAVEDYVVKLRDSIAQDAGKQAEVYLKAAIGQAPADASVAPNLRPTLIERFKAEWKKAGSPPVPTAEQCTAIALAAGKLTGDEAKAMVTPAERNQLANLNNQITAWHIESPDAPPRAMVMQDGAIFEPYVFKRGQPTNPGDKVPRRFITVLQPDVGCEPFAHGSGRLDLARAIANPNNPLTARVFVNRVWQHHFGEGLARTPSDFGVRGEPPTHPQLLDYLARSFIDSGWSIKQLHRQIVLSSTYRQSSAQRSDDAQLDPENRLLAHQNRRRIEFEPMRDAMLAVTGQLDTRTGGRAAELVEKNYTHRRSIYGTIDRQYLSHTLRTFDFASPDATCPDRPETTVPQQSLFMLNAPFVADQVRGLIARPEFTGVTDEAEIVRRLYRIIFARDPSRDELEAGKAFVESERQTFTGSQLPPWVKYAQALVMTNEFLFVD